MFFEAAGPSVMHRASPVMAALVRGRPGCSGGRSVAVVRSPPEFLDTKLPIKQRQFAAVSEPIWKILFFPRPSGCNVGETSKPFGSHLLLESASAVACQLHQLSTETLRSEWKDNDVHQPPRCAPQLLLWHGRRQGIGANGGVSLRAIAIELRRNVRFGALGAFGQFALSQSSCPGGPRAYPQKPHQGST